MTDRSAIEATGVTERLVLLELAAAERRGGTPTPALDVLDGCRSRLEALEEVAAGRFTEADLVRACRRLDERGLVTQVEPDERSPVGKGRPAYELAADPDAIRTVVSDDDRFGDRSTDGAGA